MATLEQIATLADFRASAEQSPDGADYLDARRTQAIAAAVGWVEEELGRVLLDRVDMLEFEPPAWLGRVSIYFPDPVSVVGVTYLPDSTETVQLPPRTAVVVNSRVDEHEVSLFPVSEWPAGSRFVLEVNRGLVMADLPSAFAATIRDVVLSHALGSFSDTLNVTELNELLGRIRPYRRIPLAV